MIAGRYRLERQIGRGGSGTVHLALDEVLGRRVAIKRIGLIPGSDSAELERLSGSSTIYHAVADAADGAMGQLVAPLRGGSSSLCGMLMTLAIPRLFAVDDPAACPRCVEVFREAAPSSGS